MIHLPPFQGLIGNGSAPGGAALTPVGLVHWYSGIDANSLTVSEGLTTEWRDKIGAIPFTQENSNSRPAYGTTLNGRNGLTFSSGKQLSRTVFSNTVFTFHALYVPAVATTQVVFYNGNGGANGFGIIDRVAGPTYAIMFGGHGFGVTNITQQANIPALMTVTRGSNGVVSVRVNGVEGFSGFVSMAPASPPSVFLLGGFSGTFHELVLYDRSLSPSECQENEIAIRSLYGL